jgi:hypothetical protein
MAAGRLGLDEAGTAAAGRGSSAPDSMSDDGLVSHHSLSLPASSFSAAAERAKVVLCVVVRVELRVTAGRFGADSGRDGEPRLRIGEAAVASPLAPAAALTGATARWRSARRCAASVGTVGRPAQ